MKILVDKEALQAVVWYLDEPCWYDHHGYCQAHSLSDDCFYPKLVAALEEANRQPVDDWADIVNA